ncbi:MAG: 30S ribosomal protein THX [Bacteroidota bacterium]
MGKGDRKTAKGKRTMGSYGNTRKKPKSGTTMVAKTEKPKVAAEKTETPKKAAPKKETKPKAEAAPKKAPAKKAPAKKED